jgi:hypothetical protein
MANCLSRYPRRRYILTLKLILVSMPFQINLLLSFLLRSGVWGKWWKILHSELLLAPNFTFEKNVVFVAIVFIFHKIPYILLEKHIDGLCFQKETRKTMKWFISKLWKTCTLVLLKVTWIIICISYIH